MLISLQGLSKSGWFFRDTFAIAQTLKLKYDGRTARVALAGAIAGLDRARAVAIAGSPRRRGVRSLRLGSRRRLALLPEKLTVWLSAEKSERRSKRRESADAASRAALGLSKVTKAWGGGHCDVHTSRSAHSGQNHALKSVSSTPRDERRVRPRGESGTSSTLQHSLCGSFR